MARLSAKIKIILKNTEDKESVARAVYRIQKNLKRDVKIMNSNDFLLAMNKSTNKLYFRNLDDKLHNELVEINKDLKDSYDELYESMKLKSIEDISKNSPNVREVCVLFTVTDNPEVHLKKESLIKTVRLLNDEEKTMKLILKELKTKYHITEETFKKDEPDKSSESSEKSDLSMAWDDK